MKVFLWRVLLVLSLVLVGLLVGGIAGGTWFVGKGAGLAGGAIVLGYAALGGLIFAIVGVIAARHLSDTRLRRAAIIVFVPAVATLTWLVLTNRPAQEPDSAFASAGIFTAAMERLDTNDPYLFTKVEINSTTRTFDQTGPAPDHVVYYAAMKAKSLVDIREALNEVAALGATAHDSCRAAQGPAIKRLTWVFSDASTGVIFPKGTLEPSQSCLNSHPIIARALFLIEKASSDPAGKVRKR